MKTSYQHLCEHFQSLHNLHHLAAICQWDQAAMMPKGGNEARSAALAELAVLIHQRETDPRIGDWLDRVEQGGNGALTEAEQANLREIRRCYNQARVLPKSLVQAQSLAGSRCEHAWRTQRPDNDWTGFASNLKEVVKLSREEAAIRSEARGTDSRYDSLLELYEPEMTSERLDLLFAELTTWLPGLIDRVVERQSRETWRIPEGPFAVEHQRRLGEAVMGLLGFDFDRGRLDVSIHPFCGGVPEDVRLTTRYEEHNFTLSLMGIIHETGHARYEQGLPRAWVGQPVGKARSVGLHESQSLFFEMQLGRHPAFLALMAPQIQAYLGRGEGEAFSADNLRKLYIRVKRGYIRVEADELTYPAHILVRYELERALIDGGIEVEDLPELWDQKMQHYLGLSTVGNFKDGCMQDIHWTGGAFGYFPTYTLGAMYAAQFAAALRQALGELSDRLHGGDLASILGWLEQRVWRQASLLETDELVRQATGEPLNPAWYRRHLEQRYLA